MISLILPYPPTINTYYSTVAGRRVLSKKGKDYKSHVFFYKVKNHKEIECIDVKVKIDIALHVPDRRIRDIDNIIKPMLDSLVYGRYIKDDRQVCKLSVEKFDYDEDEKDYCTVTIEEMEEKEEKEFIEIQTEMKEKEKLKNRIDLHSQWYF